MNMVLDKQDSYLACLREIDIRIQHGGDRIGDLANTAAVLKKRFPFYWVGFYFLKGERLVLGPFQGPPACVFLDLGRGVCASCIQKKESVLVPDVRQFEGHIACDPQSRSEIVIPLFNRMGEIRGVLDVDSDRIDAFDNIDRENLEKVAEKLRPIL